MIDEKTLTNGQLRKLNALRKSVGDKIGDVAFSEWLKTQATAKVEKTDEVADKIVEALSQYADDKSFRLGRRGYSCHIRVFYATRIAEFCETSLIRAPIKKELTRR
jgi:hypothetical protein